MGCISTFAKILVFVLNFICTLVGLALIIVGSIFYVAIDEYYELTKQNVIVVPALVIAVGVIIFIIAFLGCYGVFKQSKCMLLTHATILIILFIIQLVAGTYGYVQVKHKNRDLKQAIFNGMTQAFFHEYHHLEIQDLFRTLELELKCCGVDSPADYSKEHLPPGRILPASCCGKVNREDPCSVAKYSDGCSIKLFAFIVKNVKVVANVAFGFAAIEVICAIFAIYLARRIHKY